MLSIQEMVDKTVDQRRNVKSEMDATGRFHPELQSIFTDQTPADVYALKQSLREIPLREFLAKSGTTGIAGAAYLVPDKIHDDLMIYSKQYDLVPLISAQVVTGWRGGDLLVNIIEDGSYKPQAFSSGGNAPSETVKTVQATLDADLNTYGLNIPITNDLIEDANYDMVEFHLRAAAKAVGERSSELAIIVMFVILFAAVPELFVRGQHLRVQRHGAEASQQLPATGWIGYQR